MEVLHMHNYKKLTKSQVIAQVKKTGKIEVDLYPSNCSPRNQTWVQGMSVDLKLVDNAVMYNDGMNDISFDSVINNFSHYNCNNELGKRVHYYIEIKV
jgi:hypothetical protein